MYATCIWNIVQHNMSHNFYYKNSGIPIQKIRFIKNFINPLDIVNIQPDHSPATITKVETTGRKIIHHFSRDIKNNITNRTSPGRNTKDPRTKTNYLWKHISRGENCRTWWWWFPTSKVENNKRVCYTLDMSKTQFTITTGTKCYTWLTPHHTTPHHTTPHHTTPHHTTPHHTTPHHTTPHLQFGHPFL